LLKKGTTQEEERGTWPSSNHKP